MAISDARSRARAHPGWVTAVVSVIGYALVIGVFADVVPIPSIGRGAVVWLSDAIAVVNSAALVALLVGWRFIRRGEVKKHRASMLSAFTLILLFLVLYLVKVGGGFEKSLIAPEFVYQAYLLMLAVHLFLSVVSVPVVVYAVVLGLTRTPAELRDTRHATVGRVAVAAWSVSLSLGLIIYVLLNHMYGWQPRVPAAMLVPGLA
jgi:putative membrane protein